jgi:hypothetical protein
MTNTSKVEHMNLNVINVIKQTRVNWEKFQEKIKVTDTDQMPTIRTTQNMQNISWKQQKKN